MYLFDLLPCYFSLSVFALEIFDGYLYAVLNHTGVLVREKVSDSMVNTNSEHKVSATLKNSGVTISVSEIMQILLLCNVGCYKILFLLLVFNIFLFYTALK